MLCQDKYHMSQGRTHSSRLDSACDPLFCPKDKDCRFAHNNQPRLCFEETKLTTDDITVRGSDKILFEGPFDAPAILSQDLPAPSDPCRTFIDEVVKL